MKLWLELKYAGRLLRKTPGFTAICLIVLTLGVTVSLASFSFIKTLYYQELPFSDGDRFVVLKRVAENGIAVEPLSLNAYAFNAIQDQTTSYATLGAYRGQRAVLSDGETPEAFNAAVISPNLLAATKIAPRLGRIFSTVDINSANAVALISETLWRSYYSSDANIIGKVSRINGLPYTIVGVMPESFSYPVNHDVWLPLTIPLGESPTEPFSLALLAVLKASISENTASVELNSVLADLKKLNPNIYGHLQGIVAAHSLAALDSSTPIPFIISGVAFLILIIACLNFSSLLFIRAHARKQELLIRSTLGANRWQLVKKVLLESFLLCLVGTVAGVVISQLVLLSFQTSMEAMAAGGGGRLPFWWDFSLDAAAFLVIVCLVVFIWIVSGSIVAIKSSRKQSLGELGGGNKGHGKSMGNRTVNAIVYVETIVSMFLLVLCGLFVIWGYKMVNTDYGVDYSNAYTAHFRLNTTDLQSDRDRVQFIDNLAAEIDALPFVNEVTFATRLPGQDGERIEYLTDAMFIGEGEEFPNENINWVKDNYFTTMGIALKEGRLFDAGDANDSNPVLIVDEGFAANYWPGESAIGERIQLDPARLDLWYTVIGVVSQVVQEATFAGNEEQHLYRPYSQATPEAFVVLVKTREAIQLPVISAAIKDAGTQVNRNIPLERVRTYRELQSLDSMDTATMVNGFIGFALFAMILAVIGIYGVISRSITQRTNEMGIRRAIGASIERVTRLFLKQGLAYFATGAVVGGGAALLVVNVLPASFTSSLLAQLPTVLLVTLGLMGGLIFFSSYIPARQALRKEPGDALRYE